MQAPPRHRDTRSRGTAAPHATTRPGARDLTETYVPHRLSASLRSFGPPVPHTGPPARTASRMHAARDLFVASNQESSNVPVTLAETHARFMTYTDGPDSVDLPSPRATKSCDRQAHRCSV